MLDNELAGNNMYWNFINRLNDLFIFWRFSSLHLLFYVDSLKMKNDISSYFNVYIHLNDRMKSPFFLEINYVKLGIDIRANEVTPFHSFGWIDLPFYGGGKFLHDCTKQKRIFLDKEVLSIPLTLNNSETFLKENPIDIRLKFYLCLQVINVTDSRAYYKLYMSGDEQFISSLNDVILVKDYEFDSSYSDEAALEITNIQGKKRDLIHFFLPFIRKGFNHQQILFAYKNDEESEISLQFGNKKIVSDKFSIYKKCLEVNSSFCTTLFTGRRQILRTSNVKLELPDVDDIEFEPKVITIKRFLNFKQGKNDGMIIENGLYCKPDGPLNFTANLYIQPISTSKNIYVSNQKTKMEKSFDGSILMEIRHFCEKTILEYLEKEEAIGIGVHMSIISSCPSYYLDIILHFEKHKPVSLHLKYNKVS